MTASLRQRFLAAAVRRPTAGSLELRWPDGAVTRLVGDAPGPNAIVIVRRWRAFAKAALRGALGLAESYVAGDWDSPDIAAVIEIGARYQRSGRLRRRPALARWLDRRAHCGNANTPQGSRRNIAAHYDLGTAFYRAWLDRSLTYSSAIFAADDDAIEAAQANKHRRLLARLQPKPGEHLLEIGCGWGAFARLAAVEAGLKVTAITLSRDQHAFAARAAFESGLAERVRVELRDYRDIAGQYDHAVAIEMFEAVGEEFWPGFFAKLGAVLKPGRSAALQFITIAEALYPRYRSGADFIQRHIFPGGALPSLERFSAAAATAGFACRGVESFGGHYAQTLAEWGRRFAAAWPCIAPLGFDERFRRLWSFYLAYCEGGFRAGNLDLRQATLVRP
jgi:cyclopropane-fatty-acyl-phospholipid synthase